ncbi:protein-methionine-sulfoxide reductase catalytic subunit MsrP [Kordiimonas marina]|uniref:protein-methionine-sulfoxide reductase catalytic subunit MsrP n=1 Tax=Kordiimonas marina TaxID=2872312 RepID=UPI001FF413D4|nr:protein-methionine-sulfoxide reductase catalytic subunit MsrP [Kordiimonas marina]MCJ9429720.1 protein-methionine-sulfoxide reductase catalytic subunit MsrP [Kordiimonas marina]
MLIKSRESWEEGEASVTPEKIYLNRRRFMKSGLMGGLAAGLAMSLPAFASDDRVLKPLNFRHTDFDPGETMTPYNAVTGYNNYYEFGTHKDDPAKNAWQLRPAPWSVKVDGMVEKKGTFGVEDLVDYAALEERIYRHRCVEAWSMVIPWVGVPLASILKKLGPESGAKYVAFETLADRKQMPGIRWPVLDWPYREGLRMDEAMNDLAFVAVGLYGKELPNQNGAPLRLVVPWKYGFKSIKSIVRIHFTDTKPKTSWNMSAPNEYGFYSNVNPEVDHPRWSQKRERRIGEFGRRKTLMFNGYGDKVASLYTGMDLRANF